MIHLKSIALSAETNTPKLLELIMMGAKALPQGDGGSLYFVNDCELSFESHSSLLKKLGKNLTRVSKQHFDHTSEILQ